MQKVFLSYHFNGPTDPDKHDTVLAGQVETIVRSHNLLALTGANLGGGALTPEVMTRIEESDALIAMMTRRGAAIAQNPDRYQTHPWVRDEFAHARAHQKRAVAIVETGVDTAGAYAANEHIVYDRSSPVDMILKLSATIGVWKRQSGRTVPVQLLPDAVAVSLGNAGDQAQCYFRRVTRGRPPNQWQQATVYPEIGGTFIYVAEMDDDTNVQVKAVIGGVEHISQQTSQYLPVVLRKAAGAGGGP